MSVYFVQAGDGGRIKIGYSPYPNQRVAYLRRYSGPDLFELAVIDGSCQLEKKVHKFLSAHRVHDEWFKPTQEVLAIARRAAMLEKDDNTRALLNDVTFSPDELRHICKLDGVIGEMARITLGLPTRYSFHVLGSLLYLAEGLTLLSQQPDALQRCGVAMAGCAAMKAASAEPLTA